MAEKYPGWLDQERGLIRQYGCKSHDPGRCRMSPQYHGPRDGVSGDSRFCVPDLPEWPSPPYVATGIDVGPEVVLMHAPMEPNPDEIAALAAQGCNFGSAPWLGPPHSPHYGPPGSCINHRYGTCPSVNPYTRFIDARLAMGLPTAWNPEVYIELYRPSLPTTMAPVAKSSVMKKRKVKKPKKITRRRRAPTPAPNPPNRAFNMAELATALTAATPGQEEVTPAFNMAELAAALTAATTGQEEVTPALAAVVADPLAARLRQLRVSRPAPVSRTKSALKKKKKGGRRTKRFKT